MTMQKIKYLFFILITLLIYQGCMPVKETADMKDLSYLYNPLRNSIHPRYKVYHTSDNISDLSIKFFSNDLFFSEANAEGVSKSSMAIILNLYNITHGRVKADTGIYTISIRKERGKREYKYVIPLKAPAGSKYEADIVIKDLLRDVRIQAHIPFDKTSDFNSHSFKVLGHFNKYEVFNPVLRPNEFINLIYKNPADSLYIRFYNPENEYPAAPYMLLPEKSINTEPESVTVLPYSDTLPLMFHEKGIYMCGVEKNLLEGYTIFNFGVEYPGTRKAETMIEPLVYLSNPDKVSEMKANPKAKAALDKFWLDITGNVEKSRELIKIYYSRVLYANYFFTSYKEGWRTDKGMLYIIYGPPDKVYKTPGTERWGYHRQDVKSGWGTRFKVENNYLYFNFKNRENFLSNNDYTLLRSENATTYWDLAVRTWLSGVVFKLDNPSDI